MFAGLIVKNWGKKFEREVEGDENVYFWKHIAVIAMVLWNNSFVIIFSTPIKLIILQPIWSIFELTRPQIYHIRVFSLTDCLHNFDVINKRTPFACFKTQCSTSRHQNAQ